MFVLHLEEGNVDEGGVEVDELKLHCNHLSKFGHLCCDCHHER